ncbi:hypothetical protein DPMN_064392 [Dreissena polymorpha]|uniref:Uncharacterized protein n=1 Tax=Dreissena polymorpha TaxID=45954 RepID=A0A9D4CCN4_DREPO|nr:hypothetical protein DPMN_064392 [Dreissena polymorpha]
MFKLHTSTNKSLITGEGAPGLVMGPCIVEIDRIVIREVQRQLEVNRCRNEEVKLKAILSECGLCGRGTPGLVMGLCIVEIDRIVIRIVQYQLEVNRCRNEEIILKGNFVCVWPIWAGCPRIDRIVIREVQYQLEVKRCRNEEIIVWSMWAGRPRIDRIVIREEIMARTDRQTDGRTAEITTISPRFSKSVGIINMNILGRL